MLDLIVEFCNLMVSRFWLEDGKLQLFMQLSSDWGSSHNPVLTLKLPDGYSFADLKVRRCDDDAIDLDMDLVKLICNINGLSFDKVLQNPGPVVTSILSAWYKSHLAQGGAPDVLMEELKTQGQRTN